MKPTMVTIPGYCTEKSSKILRQELKRKKQVLERKETKLLLFRNNITTSCKRQEKQLQQKKQEKNSTTMELRKLRSSPQILSMDHSKS